MPVYPSSRVISRANSLSQNKRIHSFDPFASLPSPRKPQKHSSLRSRSTFDSLPVELQVEIFAFCLPTYPVLSRGDVPLLAAQVCSAWRTLIFSTPRLWASFQIEIHDLGLSNGIEDDFAMTAVKFWLERSRSYPLSFRVLHIPVGRQPDIPRSTQTLTALLAHAHRWRNANIVVPCTSIAPLKEAMPDGFPMLESLTLRILGIWHTTANIDIHSLPVPWCQLTSLDLQLDYFNLLTLDDCLDILSETKSLIQCTLSADCVLDRSRKPKDEVLLPSLKSFNLILQRGALTGATDPPEARMMSFLGLLSLSELRCLRLEWLVQWNDGEGSWSGVHQLFISFLHEVAPTLEVLGLCYLPLSETELLECMKELPGLKKLDLRFSLADRQRDPITETFLRALTLPHPNRSEKSYLPQLESFYLLCHGESFHQKTLFRMIHSRCRASSNTACFRHIRLTSMKSIDEEALAQTNKLKELGVDIILDSIIIR